MQATGITDQEIDEAVATEVMGWKWDVEHGIWERPDAHVEYAAEFAGRWEETGRVIERMSQLGYAMRFCTYRNTDMAYCTFVKDGPTGREQAGHAYHNQTRAVCIAALAAVRATQGN